MYRDLENVPYRETEAYRRNAKEAEKQKAAMHHRVGTLWPSQSGQSTSGVVRSPRFGGMA